MNTLILAATTVSDAAALWQWDIYAKVGAAVLAGLGTVFGLPLTVLQFRKTRAEIRKLELEAAALAAKAPTHALDVGGHRIIIDHSDNAIVQILADPRFLGPLLLLLDFIFASIIITLASYAVGFVLSGPLHRIILGLLSVILLVPIAREARRVKRVLSPPETRTSDTNKA